MSVKLQCLHHKKKAGTTFQLLALFIITMFFYKVNVKQFASFPFYQNQFLKVILADLCLIYIFLGNVKMKKSIQHKHIIFKIITLIIRCLQGFKQI